jgi:hypothetical protein
MTYPATAAPKQPPPGAPDPLFASNEILEVTIRAPIEDLMRERPLDDDIDAQLIYNDAELGEVTLQIGVRTRGRYRHQKKVCRFSPLRLNFRKSETGNTLFANADKLKLVTHCNNRSSRYTQGLLREFIAYRIFNVMTDSSFRVRLLRVRYADTDEKAKVKERINFAFLIEHRDQLAERIGARVINIEKTSVASLDGAHTNLGSVFQYLIGNTDFSPIRGASGERCCHNYVLLAFDNGRQLSVPYDLDMSGFVNSPYATPNPRFDLSNVRSRLYRGRCLNNEHLDDSLQLYRDREAAILRLVTDLEQLDSRTRKSVTRYIGDFYRTINDPRKVEARIRDRCI